jgi:hypothetical protein
VVSHVVPRVVSLLCASRSGQLAVHVQTRLTVQKWHSAVQYSTVLRRSVYTRRGDTWSVPVWFSADSETSADEQPVTWDSHAPVSTGLTSC